MSFLRPVQDFDSPALGEEFYRAIVVDNNDPDQLSRVKIRIEELHGTEQEISDNLLPWAMQFRPTFLGGNSELSLGAVPAIGSEVIVTHIRGEIYQPAYMFELNHNNTKITEALEDYPNSYSIKDSDGNFWHVNMEQDILNIQFNGTQQIEITVDKLETVGNDYTLEVGNDSIQTISNDSTVNVDNNFIQTTTNDHTQNAATFNITTSGNTNITASGNVVVQGSEITLNGGDPVVTTNDIDPFTGSPHPEGSPSVKAQ